MNLFTSLVKDISFKDMNFCLVESQKLFDLFSGKPFPADAEVLEVVGGVEGAHHRPRLPR